MRRSCVGVLADSSKRRDAGAPAVCLGVPFRERDDGSWDDDHEGDDDENEKAKMTALGKRRNGDENVGWKFACVGYGSAKSVSQSGRRKTFEEEEEEEELPRCRGLEILVSERVLNKNDEDDDAETTHGDQRRREERRRRGLTDAKEDKDDFIVALREKPDENEIDRKRNSTTTRSSSKSASSSEKEESGVFAGRQRRLFPPPNGTPTPSSSSSRERERKIDAEHKLPPELKTFKQRFYMQSKLIWTRMEKHAKYVYSGAFAKDL
jgi:hypothetical protein